MSTIFTPWCPQCSRRVRLHTPAQLKECLHGLAVTYAAVVEKTLSEPDPKPVPVVATIDAELLPKLIKLCHPDKHDNSDLSNEVTAILLGMRP